MNDEFRWVLMEIVPANDYTHENQTIMLYVQDIQDSYIAQLENQRELEKFANTAKHNKSCIMILVNRKYCRNLHIFRFKNDIM